LKEIIKAYKYRLYPTKSQLPLLNQHVGHSRFIYNYFLALKKAKYEETKENISYNTMCGLLPGMKKDPNYLWLKDVTAQSLQIALKYLDTAFQRFFKKVSGYPKFHKKSSRGSFSVSQSMRIDSNSNNRVFIPKFKKKGIKYRNSRDIKGEIRNATISRSPTGKWFIGFVVKELIEELSPHTDSVIGIDLGLKSFITTSDAEVVDNPKFLRKNLKKIKYLQRQAAKIKFKNRNRKKYTRKFKLALCHEKISDRRKDFLHKLSSRLINENQVICLEDLNIKGMVKNHKLALSMHSNLFKKDRSSNMDFVTDLNQLKEMLAKVSKFAAEIAKP